VAGSLLRVTMRRRVTKEEGERTGRSRDLGKHLDRGLGHLEALGRRVAGDDGVAVRQLDLAQDEAAGLGEGAVGGVEAGRRVEADDDVGALVGEDDGDEDDVCVRLSGLRQLSHFSTARSSPLAGGGFASAGLAAAGSGSALTEGEAT
jgi:hypothetical protein